MKRRMILATVVMAAILVSVIGISTLGGEKGVSAANHTLEYQYHVSIGRSLINPLCDQAAPADAAAPDGSFALCPDMATPGESPSGVANDQSIEITGNGSLSVNAADGTPNTVTGGGFYIHKSGGEAVVGRWEAKQLLMFETYGPGDANLLAGAFPDLDTSAWRTGRAIILVSLENERGEVPDGVLEIGCRLPGNDGVSGTIEGIRLVIGGGGLTFNIAADPRSTLFVDMN